LTPLPIAAVDEPVREPVPSSRPIPLVASAPAAPEYNQAAAEPRRADPLRGVGLWSLLFGILLVVEFILPTSLDPLTFKFQRFGGIFGAELGVMLGFLSSPMIGVLAILFGVMPMGTAAKGAAAGVLGVAGLAISVAFSGHIVWQDLAGEIGMVALLGGLVIRGGYPSSMIARLLVTLGVLAVLAPFVVPVGNVGIPLHARFSGLRDLELAQPSGTSFELFRLVIVVAALLVWLPGPSSGGAKVFYWAILVTMVAEPLADLVISGGTDVFKTPALLLIWAPMLAIHGLASYGLGALLGKITN
jgi:hypothetical protein